MPRIKENAPYDSKNKESILKYAKRLKGRTLGHFVTEGEINENNKGGFGMILESGYFHIESNNEPVPDFEEVGLELKSSPVRKLKDGSLYPKERLALGIINYEDIVNQSFEESFLAKNRDLLIVFYLYEKGKEPLELIILDAIEWIFPEEDLQIIRRDWNDIRDMVACGRAHEISGGMTFYLEAMPKGAGHEKDMRKQPFSSTPARQRAFGLKNRYIQLIFSSIKESEPVIKDVSILARRHIEEVVADLFAPYIGMSVKEIIGKTGASPNNGKDRYASLARAMLGVKKKKIEEFEKAGIQMKTVLFEHSGNLKESMSFPYIRYKDIVNENWEESDLYDIMTNRFLFIVYQKEADRKTIIFKGIKFWSMGEQDLETVRSVWEDTVEKIKSGDYENFVRISADRISHVRPHGRDSRDMTLGPDGKMHKKKCFWLNSGYVRKIIGDLGSVNSSKKCDATILEDFDRK